MKANELMIGDWVYSSFSELPCKVTYLKLHESGYGSVETTNVVGVKDIESLSPIPLTPEILEKNGFKKFDFHDIEGQHQWSWWLDTLTSVSLWCRELNDDPKDGWMIRIEGTLAMCCHKVEYVHELQQTLRICGIEKEIV